MWFAAAAGQAGSGAGSIASLWSQVSSNGFAFKKTSEQSPSELLHTDPNTKPGLALVIYAASHARGTESTLAYVLTLRS